MLNLSLNSKHVRFLLTTLYKPEKTDHNRDNFYVLFFTYSEKMATNGSMKNQYWLQLNNVMNVWVKQSFSITLLTKNIFF